MLSNVQLRKNQAKIKKSLLKRYKSTRTSSSSRRLNIFGGGSEKVIKFDQRLLNTMHMSLYMVKGDQSFGTNSSEASNNHYGMSASASGSSSTTTTTVSSQDEHQGSQLVGEPVAGAASLEEQIKMSKPTHTTISHGAISVIGRQRTMEDAVAIAPSLVHVKTKPYPGACSNKHQGEKEEEVMMDYDFFAVYDGHGDHGVSNRCKERLHRVVAEEVNNSGVAAAGVVDRWERVLTKSFTKMSDEIASKEQELYGVNPLDLSVGSMALVVLVSKEEIVVANCGHSRAVLFRDGAALPLTRDQQSERPEEKERLDFGRGSFAGLHPTSASIGTCSLRDQMISVPEVSVHKRTLSDDFLVIATDGLWDVVSNDTACDIVRKRCSGEVVNKMVLADGMINNSASACAAMLVELALARGSKDNISVIVAELQHFKDAIGSTTHHHQHNS